MKEILLQALVASPVMFFFSWLARRDGFREGWKKAGGATCACGKPLVPKEDEGYGYE